MEEVFGQMKMVGTCPESEETFVADSLGLQRPEAVRRRENILGFCYMSVTLVILT